MVGFIREQGPRSGTSPMWSLEGRTWSTTEGRTMGSATSSSRSFCSASSPGRPCPFVSKLKGVFLSCFCLRLIDSMSDYVYILASSKCSIIVLI